MFLSQKIQNLRFYTKDHGLNSAISASVGIIAPSARSSSAGAIRIRKAAKSSLIVPRGSLES